MLKLIESKTDHNNQQQHFVLAQALELKECMSVAPSLIGMSQLLEHEALYHNSIKIPQWREILYGTDQSIDNINFKNLAPQLTTSFEAQARRQGLDTPLMPFGLAGLIQTSDQHFVFGIRTGVSMGGYACNAPAGHCSPDQPGDNIIAAGFYEELETELGLKAQDISKPYILGYQTDPDFGRGITTILYAKTKTSFAELVDLHAHSRQAFLQARAQGLTYVDAKTAVLQQGFFNIDAQEHQCLVPIAAHKQNLLDTIESRQTKYDGTRYPVMDIARGSFLILLEHLQAGLHL